MTRSGIARITVTAMVSMVMLAALVGCSASTSGSANREASDKSAAIAAVAASEHQSTDAFNAPGWTPADDTQATVEVHTIARRGYFVRTVHVVWNAAQQTSTAKSIDPAAPK